MSRPDRPVGDDHVPDKVLEELLAAFADDLPTSGAEIDLDDPSIDRLLGLTPATPVPVMPSGAPGDPVMATVEPVPAEPVPAERLVEAEADSNTDSADPAADPAPGAAAASADAAPADVPLLITEPIAQVDAPTPGVADGPVDADGADGARVEPDDAAGDRQPEPESVKPARPPIRIGGGEDDFLDAVYLDEEGGERLRGATRSTEASIERNTIYIGDDEIEGSSGGIPIATGATMDPRLRARRIAVKRAVGRRRLKWFIIPAVVVIVVVAALATLGSKLFAVRQGELSISGARQIAPEDLQAAVDMLVDHPVLLIDTRAIEQRLERSPWVREARVSTDFPHAASIEIVERTPIATYAGSDGRYRIIDDRGVVVTVLAGKPLEFMLISGAGPNAEAGGYAGDAFRHASELVQALSPAVRQRTEEVVVGETGELSLLFHENGTVVLFGPPEELLDKLTRLEAILQRSDAASLVQIDVSTAEAGVK